MILIDAEVLIHVEQRHFAPVNSAQVHKGLQELYLRIAGGENRGGFTLARDGVHKVIVDGLRHVGCHVRLGGVNPNWQRVGFECFDGLSGFAHIVVTCGRVAWPSAEFKNGVKTGLAKLTPGQTGCNFPSELK